MVKSAIFTASLHRVSCLRLPDWIHLFISLETFRFKAKQQYKWGNLQALSVALNTVGAVSVKRTHEIPSGVFLIPFATETISNMVKRCANTVPETVNAIKQKVVESGLGHFDYTGTSTAKELWWVHAASNCVMYLNIIPKRRYLGMEQCGVLPLFRRIAMHDGWAS